MKEQFLQYVWKHRLLPPAPLRTTQGAAVEILDPGLWNHDAGPDFFNAKLKIGGELWVGNVEVHVRASDWQLHGHQLDAAYANVILHAVAEADAEIALPSGRTLPQLVLSVPPDAEARFDSLMAEEAYPPCHRIIPTLAPIEVRAWLSALTVERLEQKTRRISHRLGLTGGHWEQTFFITLARAMGFGVNSDTFEQWAATIDLGNVGKHRDHPEQVGAYFLGTAGLLDRFAPEQREKWATPAETAAWEREWHFLRSKFGLKPIDGSQWRYLRLRPQNFPHVRLLQLARAFHEGQLTLSSLLEADSPQAIRQIFHAALPQLQAASLDLLLINAASPTLFAHGQSHADDRQCDRAFALLESLKAERNHITRSWEKAGLAVDNAADSQALIQLRTRYCDRKDCLRCRFGTQFLASRTPTTTTP